MAAAPVRCDDEDGAVLARSHLGHRARALVAAAGASARTVHIRGTAYEFNNGKVRLGGAKVGVAEDRRFRATTRSDGTYDLVVPDHARVTPFITAAGYHSIHLQTFRTGGANLYRVNLPDSDGGRVPGARRAARRPAAA